MRATAASAKLTKPAADYGVSYTLEKPLHAWRLVPTGHPGPCLRLERDLAGASSPVSQLPKWNYRDCILWRDVAEISRNNGSGVASLACFQYGWIRLTSRLVGTEELHRLDEITFVVFCT